jgi:D-alanyl-D-alanine endopeptidase (penicillin-binding protein 7)
MNARGSVFSLAGVLLLAALSFTAQSAGASPSQKRAALAQKTVKTALNNSQSKKTKAPQSRLARASVNSGLQLESAAVYVEDQASGDVIVSKNSQSIQPIASITKLMTAMVALDAMPNLKETLTIGNDDVDLLKGTGSRLRVGAELTREEMLRLALMSSENRAASALSRHYPGGKTAFVEAMNSKAHNLGLNDTRFKDPTGLTAANVSSPRDLAKMVNAAYQYPLIREFSTTAGDTVRVSGRELQYNNTNALIKSPNWDIGLSKTGYIAEAGKCLVMQAWVNSKPTIIVLLDSVGKATRMADANRIKHWVEATALANRTAVANAG